MEYNSFCTTEITFLTREDFENRILSLNQKNILLIISGSMAERYNLERMILSLKLIIEGKKGNFIWFKDSFPNPSPQDIISALNSIGQRRIDLILAIGGGSSIDMAKAVSLFRCSFKTYPGELSYENMIEFLGKKAFPQSGYTDIIAVPTTTGTGSELTQWATVWDKSTGTKFSIDTPKLKPKMAMIVPELTSMMPSEITLSTGLDAFSQAVEAYWSVKTSPIIQEIALNSAGLTMKYLKSAIENPDDKRLREKLCRASVLSGLAFSQTRTTACHSISYPLTMMFNIPHGIAAAMTLAPVSEFNRGGFLNDTELFALFEEHSGLKNWIEDTSIGILKMCLSYFGVKRSHINLIAENSFTAGRIDNNPIPLNKADIVSILNSVY